MCLLLSFFHFFFQQVVFLTVYHRGPLPLRELHSTDETIVWRDPGGSWACLRPVSNYKWINSPYQRLWHRPNLCRFVVVFAEDQQSTPQAKPGMGVERPTGTRAGTFYPVTNGCFWLQKAIIIIMWPTSKVNYDHVLGKNKWPCDIGMSPVTMITMTNWLY